MITEFEAHETVDVCLVVEGCYPFAAGGVSSWLDWLIRSQPELSFGVVAITADERPRKAKFEAPPNLRFLQLLPLSTASRKPPLRQMEIPKQTLTEQLIRLLKCSDVDAFRDLVALSETPLKKKVFGIPVGHLERPTRTDLLDTLASWEVMVECYSAIAENSSFQSFFWAWRNLLGGMFSVLTAPVPSARTYHAISTGYAGLYGATASIKTGCPFLITEHGIYTNERRIDLIMADWISDMIDRGLDGRDHRIDVRDFWMETFGVYANVAYSFASKVTTLYRENQLFQRALGAKDEKLAVIPNGIDIERFDGLKPLEGKQRPTVALIGRVVPIKDIEAFLIAASHVRRKHPDVEVLILGPTDEDPAYFDSCKKKADDLGLRKTVRFTGKVDIREYLGRIDIMVLTSISEAQPLVLLEAGAARIPCVVTDVGSCREIVEGAPDEAPNLGRGGRVVPPMAPEAVGAAINELLGDHELRRQCGDTLRKRVEQYYTSETSSKRYAKLYEDHLAA